MWTCPLDHCAISSRTNIHSRIELQKKKKDGPLSRHQFSSVLAREESAAILQAWPIAAFHVTCLLVFLVVQPLPDSPLQSSNSPERTRRWLYLVHHQVTLFQIKTWWSQHTHTKQVLSWYGSTYPGGTREAAKGAEQGGRGQPGQAQPLALIIAGAASSAGRGSLAKPSRDDEVSGLAPAAVLPLPSWRRATLIAICYTMTEQIGAKRSARDWKPPCHANRENLSMQKLGPDRPTYKMIYISNVRIFVVNNKTAFSRRPL